MKMTVKTERLSEESAGVTQVMGWSCVHCGHFWGQDERMARYCCATTFPCECGKARYDKGYTACKECSRTRREQADREALEKAEIVENYEGWVYCEALESHNNGYFRSAEELALYCHEFDESMPGFAFCCDEDSFSLDLDRALENECDDHHEDMRDHLRGVDELQAAVDEFNNLNSKQITYNADMRRKVRIVPLPICDPQ
jgi:hypothetical protein